MANLNKCAICGTEYSYCPNCAGSHAWRFYTDTHEHYQIYMIIKQYSSGIFDKNEARIAFNNIGITDTSNLNGLKDNIVKVIQEILTLENDADKEKGGYKRGRKTKLYD